MSERPATPKQIRFIAGLMHELNISEPGLCCQASRLARGRQWPFATIEEFDTGTASWAINMLLRKRKLPESTWNPRPDATYETRIEQRRAFEKRQVAA